MKVLYYSCLQKEEPEVVPEFVPRNKVYNVIKKSTDWAEMIGVPTIGYLNEQNN